MWGEHKIKWKNGVSSVGRYSVQSNNEILPNEIFQQKRFKDGYTKRFGEFNTVVLDQQEQSIITRERIGKGFIYIHGKGTPYYIGKLIYNRETERFSSEFETINYPVFSDCIIFKRTTTERDKVGLIYGSKENGRIRDYNPANIAQGTVYIKRFEYQSITKSSLDQETVFRRDRNYYSTVYKEFYEKGRVIAFEKKLCCHQCGKFYYTGNLMPEENSKSIALRDDPKACGFFYTIDAYPREVNNPQHKQYISTEQIENLKDYKLINFRELDITKYDYDYRILYYPKWYFAGTKIRYYQGSFKVKECNTRFGLTHADMPVTVKDFAQKNNFFYKSYGKLINKVTTFNKEWAEQVNPIIEITTQIKQTTRDREVYAWEAMSWHSPKGGMYPGGIGSVDGTGGMLPVRFFDANWLIGSGLSYGAFYTDEGDEEVISCRWGFDLITNAGGVRHGGAEYGYSTSRTIGHHFKAYSSVSLEVAEYFKNGFTENPDIPGSFLSDPDKSIPLTAEELEENGIKPKNDVNTVEKITEEKNVNGLTDPFEIFMVTNFSTTDIDLQCYVPHVFTNTQEYNTISKTAKRLSVISSERFYDATAYLDYEYTGDYVDNFLDYITLKLVRKDENVAEGAASGTNIGGGNDIGKVTSGDPGWVFLIGYNLRNTYTAYRLQQKYTIKTTVVYSIYRDPDTNERKIKRTEFDTKFTDGSERVYWKEKDANQKKLMDQNMLPANKLFDNPEMSNGDEEANHGLESGKEYKTFNQRICAAYGKYNFLAVGTPGLLSSVFNKYLFVNFLPDKERAYELEKEIEEEMDHNEMDKAKELHDNMPDLFRPMTQEEIDAAEKKYRNRYYPGSSITLTVKRPSGKFTCGSYGDTGENKNKDCRKKTTISYSRRYVREEYPWVYKNSETDDDGYTKETYEIDFTPGRNNFTTQNSPYYKKINNGYNGKDPTDDSHEGGGNGDGEEDEFQTGESISDALNKNQKQYEISPVWKNVSIPSYYYQTFENLDKISSSYAEAAMYVTRQKGKLLTAYNTTVKTLRPWAGNIVTAAGCCPVRANNKYFIFDGKTETKDGKAKKAWAPIVNLPAMQNRFFGSGATYVNYIGEGVYPHPDGDKYIIVSSWFTDAYEGLSGIELKFDKEYITFADGKCTTGFSQPCDSALVTVYNIAGPLLKYYNIFSKDTENAKYTTNKGVFPIIKALWQPDKESSVFKKIENALFLIETQCMIEGPEYYFSETKDNYPPGFSDSYQGYKSRGLIVAIKYQDEAKYKLYPLDSENLGFFKYFEKQNEKRKKINLRRAYDPMPRSMTGKSGYYWDCEEAFGLYEISSPFTFETQLAAKMSFSVRVGDYVGVLFMFAYDIDKWPANITADNPTNDTQFPKIEEEEEYSFKSAYLPISFGNNNGCTPIKKFTDFTMLSVLCPLSTRAAYSDRALANQGKKYLKIGKTTYKGIIVPSSYGHKTGYDMLPEYVIDEKKYKTQTIKRGIVRLVRWRTMEWKAPVTNSRGEITTYNEYVGAIAQLAVSYSRPLKETVDMYYTGSTQILLCFYQKKGNRNEVEVKNLYIPQQMVWQEDISTEEQLAKGERDYKEHLIDIAKIGMFDTIVIEKKITKKNNKKDEEEAKLFEVLVVPVITTGNQTYLCVTKDCIRWEIAGKVAGGNLPHLVAEFMENVENG